MSLRQLLAWVVLTLLVLFVVFNISKAHVWFFGIDVSMPIGLVVIFSAGMGAAATALFLRMRKRSAR